MFCQAFKDKFERAQLTKDAEIQSRPELPPGEKETQMVDHHDEDAAEEKEIQIAFALLELGESGLFSEGN